MMPGVLWRRHWGFSQSARTGSLPNKPGTVFGYASTFDKTVLYSSACGALLAGAMNPLISVNIRVLMST